MGSYRILLYCILDIFYTDRAELFYRNFKKLLETHNNINLKTTFTCSNLNVIQLLIRNNNINSLYLALNYDKTVVDEIIINEGLVSNNQYMLYILLDSYKKTVNTNTFLNQLSIILDTSILKKKTNSFKAICHHLYILDNKLGYINKLLNPYKSNKKLFNNKTTNLYLNYPCFFIPFKRHHKYPSYVIDKLNVIYKIDLPDELIDVICTHLLNMLI